MTCFVLIIHTTVQVHLKVNLLTSKMDIRAIFFVTATLLLLSTSEAKGKKKKSPKKDLPASDKDLFDSKTLRWAQLKAGFFCKKKLY